MTRAQIRFLRFLADCPRRGWDGGVAKGSREKMAEALAGAGLCQYIGEALEEGGNPDRGWPCYAITDAGLAAIAAPRGEEPPKCPNCDTLLGPQEMAERHGQPNICHACGADVTGLRPVLSAAPRGEEGRHGR